MDEKIFAKNYSFLDEYRSEEITKLSNVMRKVKSVGKKTDMKADLIRWGGSHIIECIWWY
jgi:hypothetical protein